MRWNRGGHGEVSPRPVARGWSRQQHRTKPGVGVIGAGTGAYLEFGFGSDNHLAIHNRTNTTTSLETTYETNSQLATTYGTSRRLAATTEQTAD